MNLVSNAIKFTKVGNVQLKVEALTTKKEQQKICLSVTDTGIGMTQEQIENLFKPFTQADPSTTRQFGGTGLGLTISKQLLTQMQGTISLTSGKHEGTSFRITLPLQRQKPKEDVGTFGGRKFDKILKEQRHLHIFSDNDQGKTLVQDMQIIVDVAFDTYNFDDLTTIIKSRDGKTKDVFVIILAPEIARAKAQIAELKTCIVPHQSHYFLIFGYHIETTTGFSFDGISFDHSYFLLPVSAQDIITILEDRIAYESFDQVSDGQKSRERRLDFSDVHFLLVEDNDINHQIAREILEARFAEVTWAENGKVAWIW